MLCLPLSVLATTPPLVGHWTFNAGEELKDKTGTWNDLTLINAKIVDGKLDVVNNSTWAYTYPKTTVNIRSKTLVSWATLDNIYVGSGSILTIDNRWGDTFDAIVYAERQPFRWMAGSSNFLRTRDVVTFNETQANVPVQIAISYKDLGGGWVQVTLCRNGVQIGQYNTGNMAQWTGNNAEILFGKRHSAGTVGPGGIDAKIDEARIYAGAMSCPEVGALNCKDSDCDDGNACTDDACEALATDGCKHTPNQAPCSDGDACTVGDACSGGACVPAGMKDCDDGNVCTVGDSCLAGNCVTTGVLECNDGDVCTLDTCEAVGGCKFVPVDTDGDDILDCVDECPVTAAGATVDASGCSVADLCPCAGSWSNHGKYVSCVAHEANDFRKAGLVSAKEAASMKSSAAKSACGK